MSVFYQAFQFQNTGCYCGKKGICGEDGEIASPIPFSTRQILNVISTKYEEFITDGSEFLITQADAFCFRLNFRYVFHHPHMHNPPNIENLLSVLQKIERLKSFYLLFGPTFCEVGKKFYDVLFDNIEKMKYLEDLGIKVDSCDAEHLTKNIENRFSHNYLTNLTKLSLYEGDVNLLNDEDHQMNETNAKTIVLPPMLQELHWAIHTPWKIDFGHSWKTLKNLDLILCNGIKDSLDLSDFVSLQNVKLVITGMVNNTRKTITMPLNLNKLKTGIECENVYVLPPKNVNYLEMNSLQYYIVTCKIIVKYGLNLPIFNNKLQSLYFQKELENKIDFTSPHCSVEQKKFRWYWYE